MNRLRVADRLTWVAALLAAAAAAAGLVAAGLYRDAPFWVEQARATDIATLFFAVPILAAGLLAARRGAPIGRLAAMAGLLYLVYNYAIFAFSVAMYPLSVVYIAFRGLAVWSLLLSLSATDLAGTARALEGRTRRRSSSAALIAVAGLFGLMWLAQIASTATTAVLPPDLVRAGLPTNPVYALDLAIFLPLCVVSAIGLLRRSPTAALAFPMLIWLFLTSVGVFAAFVIAAQGGSDYATAPAVIVAGVGAVTGVLAALVLRPTGSKWVDATPIASPVPEAIGRGKA